MGIMVRCLEMLGPTQNPKEVTSQFFLGRPGLSEDWGLWGGNVPSKAFLSNRVTTISPQTVSSQLDSSFMQRFCINHVHLRVGLCLLRLHWPCGMLQHPWYIYIFFFLFIYLRRKYTCNYTFIIIYIHIVLKNVGVRVSYLWFCCLSIYLSLFNGSSLTLVFFMCFRHISTSRIYKSRHAQASLWRFESYFFTGY